MSEDYTEELRAIAFELKTMNLIAFAKAREDGSIPVASVIEEIWARL